MEIPKARFRIQVYDLVEKHSKTESFTDGDGATADSLIAMIKYCVSKKEYRQFQDKKEKIK